MWRLRAVWRLQFAPAPTSSSLLGLTFQALRHASLLLRAVFSPTTFSRAPDPTKLFAVNSTNYCRALLKSGTLPAKENTK